MALDELTARFTVLGFDLHGRARGRSGACHLLASFRDSWDHGDKECRVFFGARIRDPDAEWVRYKFSVSRSALASERVRRFTGDQEQFLLQAGLLRFRRLLLQDDSPGRSEETLLHSRSAPDAFVMHDPAELRADVSRVQREVLELLWQARHSGIKNTAKGISEDHVCSSSAVLDSVLDLFEQRKLVVGQGSGSGIAITPEGEVELERLEARSGQPTAVPKAPQSPETSSYDVFISHASEDKAGFVRPLAEALLSRGVKVWYEEFTLEWGASLRESIDRGLATSRHGVVVLSQHFFSKEWPQRELNGLFATMKAGERRILPIWHELSGDEVAKYSPMLSDFIAVNSSEGVPAVVERILSVCGRP